MDRQDYPPNPYENSAPFGSRNSPFSSPSPRFSHRRPWHSSTPYYHRNYPPHKNGSSDNSPFASDFSSPEHHSPNHSDFISLTHFNDGSSFRNEGNNNSGIQQQNFSDFGHGRRRRNRSYYPRTPSNRKSYESPRTPSGDCNAGHSPNIRLYVSHNCLKDPWKELTETPLKGEIPTETLRDEGPGDETFKSEGFAGGTDPCEMLPSTNETKEQPIEQDVNA